MTREEMANATVTLDGRKAKIGGTRNEFATVHIADGERPQYGVEFAWATAEHIIRNREGKFQS